MVKLYVYEIYEIYFHAKYIYLSRNASTAVGKEGIYIFLTLTSSSLKKIKLCPSLPTALLTLVNPSLLVPRDSTSFI